jgi:ABC-type bacteriocin/lantibiotic exporter with double-glycine peptidase domain
VKLDIPFYRQTTKLNCGPTALKMVLSYFGKDKEIGVFEDRIRIKEGKGVSTIRIATAAASFGFRTDLYTKYL